MRNGNGVVGKNLRKVDGASPSEAEVREALAGHFCRCTGYRKPVEAVLAAAKKVTS